MSSTRGVTLSLDLVAGIRRLSPTPTLFWRAQGLGDVVSQVTFLRALNQAPTSAGTALAIEQAYQLLLTRLRLTPEQLTAWPEELEPTLAEWVELAEFAAGHDPVPTLAASLRDRARVAQELRRLGLRAAPGAPSGPRAEAVA